MNLTRLCTAHVLYTDTRQYDATKTLPWLSISGPDTRQKGHARLTHQPESSTSEQRDAAHTDRIIYTARQRVSPDKEVIKTRTPITDKIQI